MAGWKTNLKRRLSFGCCSGAAAAWAPSAMVSEREEEEPIVLWQIIGRRSPMPETGGRRSQAGMNLATALAAERDSSTDAAKSLMRLIEETDGEDCRKSKKKRKDEDKEGRAGSVSGRMGGGDWVCCVCMERDKGAAFIPCGHTFCRVCSKDLWARRGCCPICNRQIAEILDIF
ncbi:hypothetical protein LINGRAHAP2_LOCUS28527 [Linum grandiflorum]